ncbi:MAG: toll/interleukin-1 receptor domain-containing protein [Rhodomicrobium sp.]
MSDSPQSYKYAAFVSYRHKPEDRRWAMWLIETLETFETPPFLVQRGVPAKIGVLFRDDGEMAANHDIGKHIKTALWWSKYLIVVCSPDTPQSEWVRAEIELFKSWERVDRILTLLIAEPPSAVIPPELRHWQAVGSGPDTRLEMLEPASANVAPQQGKTEEELKDLARDKLASVLLGCSFSELRDRQVERLQRATTTAYFETQVRRWGVPEGIGPLTEDLVARRHRSLRFESRGGLVHSVQRVNGHGMLRQDADGIAQWDVAYRSDGTVESIEHRDRHGQVKLKENFNKNRRFVDFLREDDLAAAREAFHGEMGFNADQLSDLRKRKAGIVRHILEFDERGFMIQTRYACDHFNAPAQDALGNFGEGYELNGRGQPTVTRYLDANRAPYTQRNGVNLRRDSYDFCGRRTKLEYLDENGYILGNAGFASRILVFDEIGNEVEAKHFGVGGEPVLNKDGICRWTKNYDDCGNPTDWACFGTDGEPILCKQGYARTTRRYDVHGNVIEWAGFGVDGEPVLHRNGYARYTERYDARGNPVEWAFFGVDGESVLDKNGVAGWTQSYDARGNVIECAYFGVEGEPVLHKNGYARYTKSYDTRGNPVEWTFFGVDGEPVLDKNGVARWTQSYDMRGNPIEWANFDVDGKPTLHRDGYARGMRSYDARGNLIDWAYFGVDGEPVLSKNGFSRTTRSYDARGNEIEWACFGVDGEPCLDKHGIACLRRSFDARGNVIEWAGFGVDGEPVLHKEGVARTTQAYDARGNVIEWNGFGVDGQPVLNKNGVARTTRSYDARSNVIEWACFGVDGEPILSKYGVARWMKSYDARSNVIEKCCFGLSRNLIKCRQGYAGWRNTWDSRGNLIAQTYFGSDNQPCLHTHGYASTTAAYDHYGRMVETIFRGLDDQPVNRVGGYTRAARNYKPDGEELSTAYFDAAGGEVFPSGEHRWDFKMEE